MRVVNIVVAALLGSAVQALSNGPDSPTIDVELSSTIVERGYRKVAVIPRFIVCRDDTDKQYLGGWIGPHAEFLSERLQNALSSGTRGRFEVVAGQQVTEALNDLQIEDLGREAALHKVADRLNGLDALVVGIVKDHRSTATPRNGQRQPELDVVFRLVSTKTAELVGQWQVPVSLSIADGAYIGECFELRRWTQHGLVNVGLYQQDQRSWVARRDFEATGTYSDIRRDRHNPLVDPTCAFRLYVVVEGQVRSPTPVDNKFYVSLDAGEKYEIGVESRCGRDVYLAVFVDGINILGKKREHPADCRYWFMAAKSAARFDGWYTGGEGKYREERFVIRAADDSVAICQGFGQALGRITAVFFTIGMEGIPAVTPAPGAYPGGLFGTGAGEKTSRKLEEHPGDPPGLILAAMTLRYATTAQVQRLVRGER